MPAYTAAQISDDELLDVSAYLATQPTVDEPAPWRRQVPAGAPRGLAVATTAGCVQCHHPLFNNGRGVMGGINADFAWFTGIVYAHPTAYPVTRARLGDPPFKRLAMGSFSPARLPEPMLRDIWGYITDLGFRARLQGHLSPGVAAANGVTYKLDVVNTGVKDTGLTGEDITVLLAVPAGTTVVTATGPGYQGVRRDEQLKGDAAVWTIPRLAAGERQTYSSTLSQAPSAANDLRGTLRWMKPAVKTGPNDSEAIAPAPLAAESR
jgi:hypothetical protein